MNRTGFRIAMVVLVFVAIIFLFLGRQFGKTKKPGYQWDGFTSMPPIAIRKPPILSDGWSVEVDCKPDLSVVPTVYQTGARAISFTLIDAIDREYWKQVAFTELQKYNSVGCGSVVSTVFIVKDLQIGRTPVGGTFLNNCIFVSTQNAGLPANDFFVRSVIHHEIAGVICRNHGGPDFAAWCKLNSRDYMGKDPLKAANEWTGWTPITQSDPHLFRYGFLTNYGTTNALKDMCTYHEMLMMSPDWLKTVGSMHPCVDKKLSLWVAFLRQLPVGVPAGF